MFRCTLWNLPVTEMIACTMVDHDLLDGPKLLCRVRIDDPIGPSVVEVFADQLRVVAG